jgi:GntR family transcriptional regulator
MQLWFRHGTEVSIREQLVTQIVVGILSGDLVSGQRLPSTRDLARRFHLHPNTVSAAYRQLERERWVELMHGSGVYVRETKPQRQPSPALAVDEMIANLFRSARELGVPLASLRARISRWLDLQPPDHFLLIEPDEELRNIVASELRRAVTLPVKATDSVNGDLTELARGAIAVALRSKAKAVREALRPGAELLTLQVRSVPSSLSDWLPAPLGMLVGIASRWDNFLQMARTFLIAAGFEVDALIFRDAKKAGWQRGLEQTAAVVCATLRPL